MIGETVFRRGEEAVEYFKKFQPAYLESISELLNRSLMVYLSDDLQEKACFNRWG